MFTPLRELGITTTVGKVGITPNKLDYSSALLSGKLAEFNNVQDGKNWKLETVPSYVSIYSTERDRKLFPNSNYYRINLPMPIKNVCSVKLIRGSIPKGEYTINEHNNNLVVIKSGITYNYLLTIGNYSISEFENLLNIVMGPINIVAKYNQLLSKMDYSCVDLVNITFDFSVQNSPYTEMGFNNDIVIWKNTKQSLNRLDLFGSQELEIRLDELGPKNLLECVLFTDNTTLQIIDYNSQIIRYIEPHKEIYTVTVSFYNKKYGTLYNFNGLENYLCICFESFKYVSPLLIPELSTA